MKKNYWFVEKALPGISLDLRAHIRVKRKVASFKTPFQKGEILDTPRFGRILVLDGIVQLSEKDEFIYHEMITHIPLFSHPNPQKVLIIGGGDGGTLREVLKHPIKEATLVEIDKKVIEVSKKYLPFVSGGAFKNKRAKVIIGDGVKFVKNCPPNFYDVVIIDSTDPSGPSSPLFSNKFYQDVFHVLTKKGLMITQSGTLWEQFFQIKKIFKDLKAIFPFVKLYRAAIPAYQDVEYGFMIGSKMNLNKVKLRGIKERYRKLNLKTKYYSPEMHLASGVLPKIYQVK